MGLGKTLQTLALICHARQAEPAGAPFLIVAPTSVVPNWAAEAARFAPGLKVVAITETQARRGQPPRRAHRGRRRGRHLVHAAADRLRRATRRLDWSGLILDEAQFVKNHQSKVYQCARRLPAPFKLAITGTPMENNLMELWSLLSITAPGLFPEPGRGSASTTPGRSRRQGDAELLAQLRRRIRPLIMRRTKEQVAADLPAKQEQVLEVELHPRHRKLYQTHLQRERQKVLGLLDDLNANRFTILRSLTLLRQLSLHAGLVDDAHARRAVQQDRRAARAAARRGRRRAPGAGVQPVHRVPRQGPRAARRRRASRTATSTAGPGNRAAVIERFKDGTARCS